MLRYIAILSEPKYEDGGYDDDIVVTLPDFPDMPRTTIKNWAGMLEAQVRPIVIEQVRLKLRTTHVEDLKPKSIDDLGSAGVFENATLWIDINPSHL